MTGAPESSLAAPGADPLAPDAPLSPGRRVLRGVVQVIGFAVGIGVLWFCASRALAPANRQHLAKLGEVTLGQSGALVGLTLLSLLANGTVFWLTIRQVKRIAFLDVVAVNCVATLLALAPFKLSIVFRVMIHRVRDALPVLTGGAWMAGAAAIILTGLAPPALASLWRRHAGSGVDALWWAASIIGVAVGGFVLVTVARAFLSPAGWDRVERLFANVPGRKLHGVLLPRGHEALRMLASPAAVGGSLVLRSGDIAVQTARFLVAATALGVALPVDDAIIIASVYFLIGAAAPTGAMGFREGGALGAVVGLRGSDESFLFVIGLVSAVDIAVVLVVSAAAAVYLRLDRFVTLRKAAVEP